MSIRVTWKVRKEAGHEGIVPHGWRMAWYEPRRRVGVYYPAPLHWILRTLREFRYRLRIALQAPRLEGAQLFDMQRLHRDRHRLADEYARGYLVGWRECFQACVEAIEEEVTCTEKVWDAGALLTGGSKPPRRSN